MFLPVTNVLYLKDYQLRLEFNDGRVKDLDLKGELYGEIFEPLLDIEVFKKVYVNPNTGTIEWPNGASNSRRCIEVACHGPVERNPS